MSDDDFINDDDDGEFIVGDDDDDVINYMGTPTNSDEIHTPISYTSLNSVIQPQIELINNILPKFKIQYDSSTTVTFQIPSYILPSSLRMVCGFYLSPILINVSLVFSNASWKQPLASFSAIHPILKQNYVGRPLVYDTIRHFFSTSYFPKESYRSFHFLLPKSFSIDHFTFDTSPLIFLLLEIIESFIDIQDHCCICHCELPFSVIKPSICDKKLCEVGFNEIGVGTSVATEIKRDAKAADLLLSIFACSLHDKRYIKPKPPDSLMRNIELLLNKIPSMKTISQNCRNDSDIIKMCGKDSLELLRWVILSNRSQLIHLPDELKLKSVGFREQFMTLIASPSAEEAFQRKKASKHEKKKQKKKKQQQQQQPKRTESNKKSLFLWHGSGGERWHSIIRNGLMNMSNKDCVHGAAHGSGIYLAKDVSTSLSYTNRVKNLYKNSELGSYLTLIALCEVIPNELFNDIGRIATLQDEEAIIVRFVFPLGSNEDYSDDYDDYGNGDNDDYYGIRAGHVSSENIPNIEDVLRYLEAKDYRKKV